MKIDSIIDQYNDKGQYLLIKIFGGDSGTSGDITKLASSLADISKIASEKFAWADFRKFPVDTQDNVILSKMYFDNQINKIPPEYRIKIAQKLDTYIDLFNIPEEIFVTKVGEGTSTTLVKEAVEVRYLLPKVGLCKVASLTDLDKANDVFNIEYKKLNVGDRVEFAKNFMKCANSFKFKGTPSQAIVKYASMMDTDFDKMRSLLDVRVAAANRIGKSGKEYTKLAEVLDQETIQGATSEDLEKLANIILDIDNAHGFDHTKYDKVMPDAYGVVFNKEAMDLSDESQEAGAELKKADIVGKYGHGILEEVEKSDGSIDKERLSTIAKKFNLGGLKTK